MSKVVNKENMVIE